MQVTTDQVALIVDHAEEVQIQCIIVGRVMLHASPAESKKSSRHSVNANMACMECRSNNGKQPSTTRRSNPP
jgi:hypothetical protein